MKIVDVNNVLAQIRALQAQAGPASPAGAKAPAEAGFQDLLTKAIDKVNEVQQDAGAKSAAFAAGEPGVEIAEVMLSLNRSQVSFKAMTEVRNRLVSAYQDIMNMPI